MRNVNKTEVEGRFWHSVAKDRFRCYPLPEGYKSRPLLINIGTIHKHKIVRNAELNFVIKISSQFNSNHAAILFRKNGDNFLGAGLGGWSSQYSIFVGNRTRISGWLVGQSSDIELEKEYNFNIRFQSGFITNFSCNNENLLISELSIRDSLASNLSSGNIGLYAWDKTVAEIKLQVKPLPNKCFIITNINDETNSRRKQFEKIIKKQNIICEFHDARDLRREHPLMAKIKQGMTTSDFVIADFGFQKPRDNVLYETGIAHSLGKPTIHVGPKSENFNETIPSDLKAQFFILEDELDAELPKTIKRILEQKSESYNYLD